MSPATLLAAASFAAALGRAQDYRLKIGLVQGAESAAVLVDEHTRVRNLSTGEMLLLSTGTVEAQAWGGRIVISGRDTGERLEIWHPSNRFVLNGESYPGRLVLRSSDSGLTAVNELELETYLEGVLPHEMSPKWPLEALKAQAVISRTFAVYNLGQHHADGFDLTSDVRSQVYKGLRAVDPAVKEAVRSTQGQVLTWRGKVLNAFFHSCCGGHTRAAHRAWSGGGEPEKPLKGVVDGHCRVSPHYQWEAYFPASDVLRAVQEAGHMVTELRGLQIGKRERTGHAADVIASTEQGSVRVPIDPFRRSLDPTQLKSGHLMRILRRRNGYLFEGRGFGHGVGLCQWGASEQARKGRLYRKILEFYYPASVLRSLE